MDLAIILQQNAWKEHFLKIKTPLKNAHMDYMLSNFLVLHLPIIVQETKERKYIPINLNSWTYRIYPTVLHMPFTPIPETRFQSWITNFDQEDKRLHVTPQQMRWKPIEMPLPTKKITFIDGITTMCGAGNPSLKVFLFINNQELEWDQYACLCL